MYEDCGKHSYAKNISYWENEAWKLSLHLKAEEQHVEVLKGIIEEAGRVNFQRIEELEKQLEAAEEKNAALESEVERLKSIAGRGNIYV